MDENRILITSVQIKNFRSIRNINLDTKNFNIFVGLNDAGKSNFLKALNLFFNSQTDYNTIFDFQNDFTYLFPKKSHSTREIKICLKFSIPNNYKENGIYIWEKSWRTNNYFKEKITNINGEEASARSRIPGTLKQIRFRYVPAVKSKEYYKTLLSSLYHTAASSLTSPLKKSTEDFSNVLRDYTRHISEDVLTRLHINSELSIPSNLSDIFKSLIFKTSSELDGIEIPLDFRGDGIQARHIPIILKYIADEDRSKTRGSTRIVNIWGFEEPENGVELAKAFEMASEFSEYSKEIQLFVSTHSPAFYMKKSDKDTNIYFASKKFQNDGTIFTSEHNTSLIGENMGLMPLIAPFISDQMNLLEQTKQLVDEQILTDKDTILVEGKTDKDYLTLAIQKYSPELTDLLNNDNLRIFAKNGQGGTTQLFNWAMAWLYSGNTSKLYILFDKDKSGRSAKNKLENDSIFKKRNANISVQFLQPDDKITNLIHKHIDFYFEIEHLLSIDFWKTLKEKDYVIPREDEEIMNMFKSHMSREKTLDNIIDEHIDDYDIINTIVTFNPKDEKKNQIKNLVANELQTSSNSDILIGLERTIKKIEKKFVKQL